MNNDNVKLLLISDDPADAKFLKSKFATESGSSLKVAFSRHLAEGLLKLSDSSFDVIVLGLSPCKVKEGISILHELRSLVPHLPVIILSSSSDPDRIVEWVREGAQEYLVKSQVDGGEILKKVHRAVERQHLFADRDAVIGRTFWEARRDPLTDLPNRRLLWDQLRVHISKNKQFGQMMGILFIDLDRFKGINDRFGHETGDHVLEIMAHRLRHILRRGDTVGRLGGDEFVLLVQNLKSPVEASLIARRILRIIESPLNCDGQSLQISASIGISLCPQHGFDPKTLLKNADATMYRVKNQGGGNFEVFQDSAPKSSADKMPRHDRDPGPRTILIVEDDEDIQEALRECLDREGYLCQTSSSIEEAIQSLKKSMPHLILLDLGFRKSSGFTLLRHLFEGNEKKVEIPPVLVMSSHSEPEIVALTKQMGARQFIPKPFDPSRLVSEVRSLIH